MGVADLTVKPFSLTELAARIGAALRSWEATDTARAATAVCFGGLPNRLGRTPGSRGRGPVE